MATSSQKFIARNRAPRVQIEYDVELYGAQKKIQLPFVMGVMADLSGTPDPDKPLPPLDKRKFVSIDLDSFDSVMRSIAPRVACRVPNTITGEGELPVTMSFESMSDFTPGAVARKVEPLRKLLEARERLSHLITFMDGKPSTESLLSNALKDRNLIDTLAATKKLLEEKRAAEAAAKKAQSAAAPAQA